MHGSGDEMTVKRGLLRPHTGPSRTPLFIVVGLAVVCALLLFNYMQLSSERTQLSGDLQVAKMKWRGSQLELKDCQAQHEKLRAEKNELSLQKEKAEQKLLAAEESTAGKIRSMSSQLEEKESEITRLRQEMVSADTKAEECEKNATGLLSEIESLKKTLKTAAQKEEVMKQQKMIAEQRTQAVTVAHSAQQHLPDRYNNIEANNNKQQLQLVNGENGAAGQDSVLLNGKQLGQNLGNEQVRANGNSQAAQPSNTLATGNELVAQQPVGAAANVNPALPNENNQARLDTKRPNLSDILNNGKGAQSLKPSLQPVEAAQDDGLNLVAKSSPKPAPIEAVTTLASLAEVGGEAAGQPLDKYAQQQNRLGAPSNKVDAEAQQQAAQLAAPVRPQDSALAPPDQNKQLYPGRDDKLAAKANRQSNAGKLANVRQENAVDTGPDGIKVDAAEEGEDFKNEQMGDELEDKKNDAAEDFGDGDNPAHP